MISPFILSLLVTSGWQPLGTERGISIERRQIAGSPFPELRISGFCPRPPEAVFAVIWGTREYFDFQPNLKHLEVLREDGDVRVVYAQITLPVVADRDYILWNKKRIDRTSGLHQIDFETTTDPRKPPASDHVRVRSIRGSWTIEPTAGGSDITYVVHTDPGGDIPSWASNAAQRSTAPDFVRSIINRSIEVK